jgi:hypothetical protein
MVFDREGNYLRSFGQGYFSDRTHGLYIAQDSSLLVADDGIHTVQKFTRRRPTARNRHPERTSKKMEWRTIQPPHVSCDQTAHWRSVRV